MPHTTSLEISSDSAGVAHLFEEPQRGSSYYVTFEDLPYITRPLIETTHAIQPDVVLAADRGGRPVALAMMMGWKYRFPGERFPTHDSKIHLGRISARSVYDDQKSGVVHNILTRAGIGLDGTSGIRPEEARVALVDDWAVHGDTYRTFVRYATSLGIQPDNIHFMTMCGPRVGENHTVGDRERDPQHAEWNNDGCVVGVSYSDCASPAPNVSSDSLRPRQKLAGHMATYYQQFAEASSRPMEAVV